ncbi:right-handed parallel beta-helix repeat-containing protein [Noviherbaspirillum saxi]|uniref:Right-handed parallel beta-helix repeat-containing protein n=1 Tax=Noviherbaspirillum saxi TaxID=2320863 RepID=A0A3A3FPB1_9BURK|nr:right-handed parallel beta-helix repeat-containing protein [Noviherbaspirillum saxi]RJF97300.1 right-handed parallel beta-helix repeat-containing protein [Noviherbaspirillum saxi]
MNQMYHRMWKVLAARVAGAALTMPVIALAGGDFRADVEAKFLMVINEPGTYRLSDNLVVADAHTTAIEINADDVTIDLNGFSIHGPGSCTQPPVSCSLVGTGNGIHALGREKVVVKNGGIYGMGNVGIYLKSNSSQVESVQVSGNGSGGIVMFGGLIRNSVIEHNGGDGIAGVDILLQKSVISDNQQYGFKAYGDSSYADSTFGGNNNNGVQVDAHATSQNGNMCNAMACTKNLFR